MRNKKRRKARSTYGGSMAGDPGLPRIKVRSKRSWFRFRLNRKAVLSLIAGSVLVFVGYLSFARINERNVRAQALANAQRLYKDGNIDLAMRNLDLFLAAHPNDLTALELQAEIRGDTARNLEEAQQAVAFNDRLLRMDPRGEKRDDTRRRLVQLYVRISDAHNTSDAYRLTPEAAAHNRQYQAAARLASEIVYQVDEKGEPVRDKNNKKVGRPGARAGDHRLLAMALEGLAVPGEPDKLAGAIEEYSIALGADPTDAVTADRLALIYLDRLKDDQKGRKILGELVAARDTPEARLIRYHFFMKIRHYNEAAEELETATRLAGSDMNVRLTAAGDSIRRGDDKAARGHLAAIPVDQQGDLRVQVMRGMIDFNKERPDEAIVGWRQGLRSIGGADAELTWWLAHALLRMGKVSDARPLISQYRRLAGASDEAQPLYQYLLAELDEKLGRPTRALFTLEKVRERIGEKWQSMVNLAMGRCYESIWDETRALSAYRRANLIDPRLVEPRIAAARLLASKPEEAVLEIRRGLEEDPEESWLQVALVGALLRQQAARPPADRSWREFDLAMARALNNGGGTSPLLILIQANRLALIDDISGAIALLRQGIRAVPGNAAIWIALAEGLNRTGQAAEALKVLERASAKDAAGDRAPVRIARARLLLAQGRGREARDLLILGEKELPPSDRPQVWEALGRVDASRGNTQAARVAFSEWSKLLPDDPRPRLALLELAEAVGDTPAINDTLLGLLEIGGKEDIAWRLCQAQAILWRRAGDSPTGRAAGEPLRHNDPRRRELEEANRLVEGVMTDAPEVPAALLLKGQVLEQLKPEEPEKAINYYRKAYERGATSALHRLVGLLTRFKRFDELAELKLRVPGVGLDQLSALSSYRAGDLEAARRFVEQVGQVGDRSPGTVAWQSRMFEVIGKRDQAEATLREAVDQDPTDVDRWIALVQSLGSHGKAREASAAIEAARARVRSTNLPLDLARLAWSSGDRAAADRAYRAILADRPGDVRVQATASRYFEETGRKPEAIACLREARKLAPGDRGLLRQLATILSGELATWPEASSLIGEDESSGNTAEDRLARAMVLSNAPDPSRKGRSIDLFEALVADLPASDPMAVVARDRLARALLRAGRAVEAVQVAAVSAESGTDRPAVFLLAEALFMAGKLTEAARQIERLEAFNADDPVVAELRVRWILATVSPMEAAEALERAATRDRPGGQALARSAFRSLIAMGPGALDRADRVGRWLADGRPAVSWMPARVMVRKNRIGEALELVRGAEESNLAEDRRGVAELAMEVATAPGVDPVYLAGAEAILENVARRDPADYTILVYMAMFRHLQGRFEEEARAYRSALEIRPGDPVASNNLALALSGALGHPDEALAVLDEMVRRNGPVTWALHARGVVLTRLGRFDDAIKALNESAGGQPTRAHLFHLARACQKANRMEDFRRYREQARRSGITPQDLEPYDRGEFDHLMTP